MLLFHIKIVTKPASCLNASWTIHADTEMGLHHSSWIFTTNTQKKKNWKFLVILLRVQKLSASSIDLHTGTPVVCGFFFKSNDNLTRRSKKLYVIPTFLRYLTTLFWQNHQICGGKSKVHVHAMKRDAGEVGFWPLPPVLNFYTRRKCSLWRTKPYAWNAKLRNPMKFL